MGRNTLHDRACKLAIVWQPKGIFLPKLVLFDKVFFFLLIIYLWALYYKIQVGVELLTLGNLRWTDMTEFCIKGNYKILLCFQT